jgi:hypothetical protein
MTTLSVRAQVREPPPELLQAAGLGPQGVRLAIYGGAVGLACLAAAALVTRVEGAGLGRFMFAYLPSFMFFLTVSLGALFFVVLQHLTRAGWSVVVRRIAELLAANVVLLAVLALVVVVPTVAGSGSLYAWAARAPLAGAEALGAKAAYLNGPFFALRAVIYFALWLSIARFYLTRSSAQDTSGDAALTSGLEKLSAAAMLALALSVTFAAFDFVMSVDPAWSSTVFGVYVFAGCAVGFFAALALTMMALQASGRLRDLVNTEHYHDVGKLLFAFVFFWGYIAFSQFLLIWYANIPEETRWYRDRLMGGWLWLSLGLLFGHFIVPFLGLMSRAAKRRRALLAFWAFFMLAMHYIDLYWLIVPAQGRHVPFGLVDVLCFLGLAALYVGGFLFLARQRALVPLRDPRLSESLAFENV